MKCLKRGRLLWWMTKTLNYSDSVIFLKPSYVFFMLQGMIQKSTAIFFRSLSSGSFNKISSSASRILPVDGIKQPPGWEANREFTVRESGAGPVSAAWL